MTASTLQRWFASTDDRSAGDPYFLYVASNVGSLIALLVYPVLIEPALSVRQQTRIWAILYGFFVVLSAFCFFCGMAPPAPACVDDHAGARRQRRDSPRAPCPGRAPDAGSRCHLSRRA